MEKAISMTALPPRQLRGHLPTMDTETSCPTAPASAFPRSQRQPRGAVIVLSADGLEMGEAARACDPDGVLPRAAKVNEFKGCIGIQPRCRGALGEEL